MNRWPIWHISAAEYSHSDFALVQFRAIISIDRQHSCASVRDAPGPKQSFV
jgi:hypothetical protein